MRKTVVVLILAALGALAWFFFKSGGSSATGHDPLDFVPADTPYVFANLEPIPDAVAERYLALGGAAIPQWRGQLARSIKLLEIGKDEDSVRIIKWMRALDVELATHTDQKSLLQAMGINGWQTKAAIYGVGLAPVMRISLADPAKLVALVERLEASAGEKLPRFIHPGITQGWSLDVPDAPIVGVFAIVENHLVATLLPRDQSAATDELLGLVRPKRVLSQSADIAKLNAQAGFTPYGSGYIDTAKLLDQFRQPATPLETAFLAVLKKEKPQIPAECASDVNAIVAAFPRAIGGYTTLDGKRIEALGRIETSTAIAQALETLLASTPGLVAAGKSLASFSFAIKPGAVPAWANTIAENTAKNPWTCPALSDFNEYIKTLRDSANNPAVYAAGPMANSLHLVLNNLKFIPDNEEHPVEFSGKLLIGSDNPAGLVGMAKNFLPQVAELKLAPGAPPQAVPAELTREWSPDPVFVAQTATALGFSVGAGEEKNLPQFLQADAATSQPVLQMSYRGELMVSFAAFLRLMAEKSTTEPEREEMLATAQMLEQSYGEQVERLGMTMEFSGKGIEFKQEFVLK